MNKLLPAVFDTGAAASASPRALYTGSVDGTVAGRAVGAWAG